MIGFLSGYPGHTETAPLQNRLDPEHEGRACCIWCAACQVKDNIGDWVKDLSITKKVRIEGTHG